MIRNRSVRGPAVCVLALTVLLPLHAQNDPVPLLIDKLENSDSFRVRTQAAAILGQLKDARALEPLITRISNDDSYAVRGAAAGALGTLGGKRAVGPLFQALEDPDPLVRSIAEKSLAKVEGDDVAAAFRVHLLEGNATEQELARGRLIELSTAGDRTATAALLEALPMPAHRPAITTALGKLPANVAPQVLVPALQADDAEVRATAATLLGAHPSAEVLDALARAYERAGEEESVKAALRVSLSKHRALLDLDSLISQAKQGDSRAERARAIRMLGVSGSKLGTAALEQLLADDDHFIQGTAALALGDAGDRTALPKLQKLRSRTDNPRLQNILDAVIGKLQH